MSSGHSFYAKDRVLTVERTFIERVFREVGCTNVSTWDLDVLAMRVKRLPIILGAIDLPREYSELAQAIAQIGDRGRVIIVNDVQPIEPVEDALTKKMGKGKKTRKRRVKNSRKRGELFSFEACGIPEGATLHLKKDPTITCTVVGDPWKVDFGDDDTRSFTSRTRELLGVKASTYLSPMHYWTYNGKLLRNYYKEIQRGGGKTKAKVTEEQEPETDPDIEFGPEEMEEI